MTTILLILLAAGPGALRAAPAGLVHHWNFDEGPDWHDSAFMSVYAGTTAVDSVGAADATLRNMSASNWVSGRQFTGLDFDGINDHLTVTGNLANTLGGTASLSFWLKTAQTGTASSATAPGVAGVAGSGLQWGWLDDAGRIGVSVDGALLARSGGALNDGQWHHVVLTRDAASGVGQAFVDGALSQVATGAAGAKATTFSSLGRIEGGGYFRGRLDQVHVFNTVISTAMVATLRDNHAPKCWDVATEGVNNRAFSTASIFSRTYDVENDPVTVQSWTQPAHGAVAYNGDGSFTFTATLGYLGADRFAVVVGDGQGGFHRAYLNVTVMSEPPGGGGIPVTQFTNFAPLTANGLDLSHTGWRIPRAVDWDHDGRLDLLVGGGGYAWCYLNTGTTSAPVFAAGVKVQAAGTDIYAGTGSSPLALVDLTGDGVPDLVLADSAGKLRVYRNTAAANAAPVYVAPVFVKHTNGTDFVLADRRFDLGDWDGDGKPDLVTGTYSGNIQLFLNTGTAADPRFSTGTALFSDSYQIYPRLFDLNGNGLVDLLRGINWGSVVYWRDAGSRGLGSASTLSITDTNGAGPDLHGLTDGPVVDFGDFNGDGKPDLVVGGHSGDKLFLAYGVQKTVADSIAEIEAIYDANPTNVGVALGANTNALLNVVNSANGNLISHLQNGTLGAREALYAALTNHIGKYGFLKYQTLNTNAFHHVPSIVLQNWVMLEYALADTPTRRAEIADVMGLTNTMRTIFLETGLALGDNGQSVPATYGTIRDFQRRHPRELFPDALLTTDQLYGDGRGGFLWTPNSTKNTFGQWALGNGNEWAGDLTAAIEGVLGAGAASGDYFTFVMGHEVTHSLDGYVNARANTDLRKRWGLMLCTAAGPDVIPGANGWWDWNLTKANFLSKGYWDGVSTNWDASWASYWNTGYGSQFKDLSFMRFDISWFLGAPQESLATQANHHWANGLGRLIGATDRFRRATTAGLPPLRANINEVATFIDYLSAGLNRVNLVETKNPTGAQVNWIKHYADLERDDRGYIRRLTVEGQTYQFEVGTNGVVTDVITSLITVKNDAGWTFRDTARQFDVLANDSRLEGGPVQLRGLVQPAHGTASSNADSSVTYRPAPGYVGTDTFSYVATGGFGSSRTGVVSVTVLTNALTQGLRVWYRFDETNGAVAIDASGNNRTGTVVNGAAWVPGHGGGALNFDGTNDYVSVPVGAVTGLGSQVTIAFWAYGNPDQQPVANSVLNANDGAGNRTLNLHLPWSDGTVYWDAGNSGGSSFDRISKAAAATNYEGRWTHWAVTKNASAGQMAIYQNGQLWHSGSGLTRTFPASISAFRIGSYAAGGTCFPGAVDDFRVYPTALDGGQVQAIYEGAETLMPPAFTSDPVLEAGAIETLPYSASLAGHVSDTNAGEVLTFAKVGGPAWLAVAADGSLSGTPAFGDIGTNAFTVRVRDSAGFIDEATLRITVTVFSGNHPPAFAVDPMTRADATEDAAYAGPTLAGSAADVDAGDTLTFSKVAGPDWLTVAPDGALGGTPAQADVGTNTFAVQVTDSGALSDAASLSIVVSNVNDAPVWNANSLPLPDAVVATPYSGTLSALATDEDIGDSLAFSKQGGPAWLSVAANGALSGTPGLADLGTNAFTVRAQDLAGSFSNATVLLAVVGLAPVITSQPLGATVPVGGSNLFAVGASGTAPLAYQWFFNTNGLLAAATNRTLSLAGLTTNQAGAYRVLVSNAFGTAYSSNAPLTVSTGLTLAEVLDAPALAWTNGGTGVWTGQVATTHDGVDAAQSALIGLDSRSNWVQTVVSGPGTLMFWWRVSSETSYDYLNHFVDSTRVSRISGEVAWQQVSNRIAAGSHLLRWIYSKDISLSNGQDCGWVDQVMYVADAPVITLQPVGATVLAGSTVTLSVAASGVAPLFFQWYLNSNAVAGATNRAHVLAPAATNHTGPYYAIVTNSAGRATSRTAVLEVITLWNAWQRSQFPGDASTNEAVAGRAADPDQDGQDNRTEYAYGTDPKASNRWPRLDSQLESVNGQPIPVFRYQRRLDPCDVVFTEESSLDAATWSTGLTTMVALTPDTNGISGTVRTRSAGVPESAPARLFRLRLTLP